VSNQEKKGEETIYTLKYIRKAVCLVIHIKKVSINAFGGVGGDRSFRGEYTGLDISEEMGIGIRAWKELSISAPNERKKT
jgi:hypothetical protein